MSARVYFDGHCRHCRRFAALIRRLDRAGRLEPVSFRSDRSYLAAGVPTAALERELHVVSGSRVWRGFPAVEEIARRVPLLWWSVPLLRLAGSLGLGDRSYRWLAARRVVVPDAAACSAQGCRGMDRVDRFEAPTRSQRT